MRVPDHSLPKTVTGKWDTRVVRRTLGNIPFKAAATFPRGLRKHVGTASSYYRQGTLPPGAPALKPTS